MPNLKAGLQALYPTMDLETSARSRSGARLVTGRGEPEIPEANYLPLLAVVLGGLILATAFLKPNRNGSAGGLLAQLQNPNQQQENPSYQMQNWQQPDENYQNLWPGE